MIGSRRSQGKVRGEVCKLIRLAWIHQGERASTHACLFWKWRIDPVLARLTQGFFWIYPVKGLGSFERLRRGVSCPSDERAVSMLDIKNIIR